MIFLNLLLLTVSFLPAAEVSVVSRDQFQVGALWQWLYSERDPLNEKKYNPYYIEEYEVIEVQGDLITLEMRSRPVATQQIRAHHRIRLDFEKCERASKDPRYKNFTIYFYTANLGQSWKLVSSSHKNLPFTEKFNCTTTFPTQKVVIDTHRYMSQDLEIFQIEQKPPRRRSWYFKESESVQGVAAIKHFDPDGSFKFELILHRP